MTDEHAPLGLAILRERERRFGELLSEQCERVRRRRSRQALVAACGLVAVGIGITQFLPSPEPRRRDATAFVTPTAPHAIEVVERPDHPLTIEYLTDDGLVMELRAAGLDLGIARVGERVLIVGR
jgi:hypothetical protein